jgi:hypothetical protein
VQALQDQHPELQHHIHRRAPAPGPARPTRRPLQDRPELLELNRPVQHLQRVASRRDLPVRAPAGEPRFPRVPEGCDRPQAEIQA